MPIEVRQLVIKSSADCCSDPGSDDATDGADGVGAGAGSARLRDEILAECKAWMEERLQQMRER